MTEAEKLKGTIPHSEVRLKNKRFWISNRSILEEEEDDGADDNGSYLAGSEEEEDSSMESEEDSSEDEEGSEDEDDAHLQQGRNLLIGSKELEHCVTKEFMCPKCKELSFEFEEEIYSGLASGAYACCTTPQCGHSVSICHVLGRRQESSNELAPRKKTKSTFPDYALNHYAVLMMHMLGIGLRGMEIVMSFLGLAPGVGSRPKWKNATDDLGVALEIVSKQVMEDNIAAEVEATKIAKEKELDEWILEQRTLDGKQPSVEDIETKRKQLLQLEDGKIGIAVGMDGAWQKRTVGVGQYNSRTGHNMAVGMRTGKILNVVVYSKHCRMCEIYEKKKVEVPEHRCSRNYDTKGSAKAMEPLAAVQHCVEIAGRDGNLAYVHTLVTDDDSSTRANCRHSYKEQMIKKYGTFNKRQRDEFGWPRKKDGKSFVDDLGKLPMDIPPVKEFLSDVGHRVKCFGKVMYGLKKKMGEKKKDINKHVTKYDCDKIKHLAGNFFKQEVNQQLSFDEFTRRGHCIYLHHFDDHSCCDKEWCRRKQVEAGLITERDLPDDYSIAGGHFRGRSTVAEKKFMEIIKGAISVYLSREAMWQVYHSFSTQKNESINRKMVAVADKNRFLGGTMALNDRALLVAITDSLGHKEAFRQIHKKLGVPFHPMLEEYCKRRDKIDHKESIRRKKKSVKKKRVATRNKTLKEGLLADQKAKKDGTTYGSCIAIDYSDNRTPKRKREDGVI
jgi:hypothetical protein